MWEAGPLINGVLIGMTFANGYTYPIAIAGASTLKLAAMTLRCTSHALWHFGVHYLLDAKKSPPPDEDEWLIVQTSPRHKGH